MAKREYVEANKRWLEEKAKEEGVMALPRGIYYKVLKQGDPKGAQPSRRSIVTAHYTGWTINGKKFDSSRGGTPFAMRLSDLIDGWIVAMQQMHVGDQWELYIPAPLPLYFVLTVLNLYLTIHSTALTDAAFSI
jgi:FKBP-type peptidyl-prolyl cis-trans isomerase